MAARRQLILEAFRARLLAIQIEDGFDTDAGDHVHLGVVPELGPDDSDIAVAITVGDEASKFQGENVLSDLPVEVHALAKADLAEPWIASETVLADIKRAVELADRTLGGLVPRRFYRGPVRTRERAVGSTTVGITITYLAPIVEKWGHP